MSQYDSGWSHDEAVDQLRQCGLKATEPRLRVLEVLSAAGSHLSADDVLDALDRKGPPLQRGSVYNVLATLLAHGLLMMADAGPGRALYELNRGWHHHFVCRACGGVWDVPCLVGSKPCLLPPELNVEVDEAQVIFRGRCAECRRLDRPRELPTGIVALTVSPAASLVHATRPG